MGALEPQLSTAWEASKPFFHQLGKIIIDYSLAVFRWLQENFPGYVLWAQDTGAALAQGAVATFQKISEAFLTDRRRLAGRHFSRKQLLVIQFCHVHELML